MAVIKRAVLYGEAKDIADRAIKKARPYDPNLINLQQQRDIIDAQQQGLIAGTQSTLRDVSKNIYRAKRQAKAASASLGLIGDLALSREQQTLQTDVNDELARVIDQTEQGAISIAGQQSAINKAEVQFAQDAILSDYADTLIDQGNVAISRDIGREALAAIGGVVSGGLTGFLGGKAFGWSTKALRDPTSGVFKKALAGTALGLLPMFGAQSIYNITEVKDRLADDFFKYGTLASSLGGLVGGLGRGFYDRAQRTELARLMKIEDPTSLKLKDIAEHTQEGFWAGGKKRAASLFEKSADDTIKDLASKSIKQSKLEVHKKYLGDKSVSWWKVQREKTKAGAKVFNAKAKKFFSTKGIGGALGKLNLATTIASTALGAIIGGVSAGTKQRYRLDMDKLLPQETAQQFQDFGLDLEALTDKVYNEYRRPWDK